MHRRIGLKSTTTPRRSLDRDDVAIVSLKRRHPGAEHWRQDARTWETAFAQILDPPAFFRAAADFVVLVHVGFVVFVILGGLLVARWPRMVWLHLLAVGWGIGIELGGWICPLTPLENLLRERAGSSTYHGDFIEYYLLPVLYPAQLTRLRQIWFGVAALIVNLCVYAYLVRRARVATRSELP